MKLNQLEIFCKIVELGSFSKAAEAVHLSQPTLTEHIKSLEYHLGLPLLDRLGREVRPTKAGLILQDYARKIFQLKKEAEQTLHGMKGDLRGDLTLGASTIPGEYILPPMIKRFRDDFPDTAVEVTIGDTRTIIADTIDSRVELGIVGAKMDHANLDYHPFVKDELICAVSADSDWADIGSLSLEKLSTIPFIIREEGSGTRMTMENTFRNSRFHTSHLHVVMTLGSTAAVIQAIKSGAGCSILSRKAIEKDVANGELIFLPIEDVVFPRDFFIILRRRKAKSPLCDAFFSFLFK